MDDIFVSFPFDGGFNALFRVVHDRAARHKLNAVRIDQSSGVTISIADSIHRRIRESRLIIADVTGNNPNVLNEIGIAQALGKPLLLITQGNPARPRSTSEAFKSANTMKTSCLHWRRLSIGQFLR